jgi:hypothetical protein
MNSLDKDTPESEYSVQTAYVKQQRKFTIHNLNLDNLLNKDKNNILSVYLSNSLRNDDGIGEYIFEKLKDLNNIKILNVGASPENYISKIIKYDVETIIFIDSVILNTFPGDIQLIESIKYHHLLSLPMAYC